MKKVAIILAVLVLGVPSLFARRGGPGHGPRHRYDVSREKVYSGVVTSVKTRKRFRGERVVANFKCRGKEYRIGLGPKKWVTSQGITIPAGSAVKIIGIKFTGRRGERIIARIINVSGKKPVKLRDTDGRPLWPRPERRGGHGPGDGGPPPRD